MRYLYVLAAMLISLPTEAARVSSTGTITGLVTYSEQAGFDGDVYVEFSAPHATCSFGFWLRSADTAGYRNTVSFLLSALHTGTEVTISALNDAANIWSGSAQTVCRMDQVKVAK